MESFQDMKYVRKELRPLKTDEGNVVLVFGLFLVMFLFLIMYFQVFLYRFITAASYVEDAMTDAAMATLNPDLIYHEHPTLEIDGYKAFNDYYRFLCENLNLSDIFADETESIICGVTLERIIIYNVYDRGVGIYDIDDKGNVTLEVVNNSMVLNPFNESVENTGIYAQVKYGTKGIFGLVFSGKKRIYADIVLEDRF